MNEDAELASPTVNELQRTCNAVIAESLLAHEAAKAVRLRDKLPIKPILHHGGHMAHCAYCTAEIVEGHGIIVILAGGLLFFGVVNWFFDFGGTGE